MDASAATDVCGLTRAESILSLTGFQRSVPPTKYCTFISQIGLSWVGFLLSGDGVNSTRVVGKVKR